MSVVTVYSTPTCPWCHKTKDFLTAKGVAFTDVDVSTNETKANEMVEKSGQMGMPIIDIDGEIIIGFNQDRLTEVLHLL
jgi:glutaredoxin-like YruB-family protein